jgi:hypothetical protein
MEEEKNKLKLGCHVMMSCVCGKEKKKKKKLPKSNNNNNGTHKFAARRKVVGCKSIEIWFFSSSIKFI